MKKITDGDCVPVMLGTWAWGDKLSFGGEYPEEELSGMIISVSVQHQNLRTLNRCDYLENTDKQEIIWQ